MIAALSFTAGLAATPSEAIAPGRPVSVAFRALGDPIVRNTSVGHVWIFTRHNETVRVTTGDDGRARMVDIAAQGITPHAFPVPGTAVQLRFGISTAAQTAASLAPLHDFSTTANDPGGGTTAIAQGYRLDARTELVLLFNPVHAVLQEAFWGRRSEMALAGLIPGPVSTVRLRPARIEHLGTVASGSPLEGRAYVRIQVSAAGSVTGTSVFVSSGSTSVDAAALTAASRDVFTPAMRNGVAVPSVYFARETFARSGP